MKVTVVFLGKRGAGERFIQLFKDFEKYSKGVEFNYVLSRACSKENPKLGSESFNVKTFESALSLFATPIILLSQISILIRITKFRRHPIIFVLPSPSDYFLLRILRIFQFPIFIFIHDEDHHSGELWPNKRSVKFRFKIATKIIVLSQFMKMRLSDSGSSKVHFIQHPIFPISSASSDDVNLHIPSNFLLFVGRLREYKGVADLLKAYSSIETEAPLVIAGEGKVPTVLDSRVSVINRWLTDSEIHLLITKAMCVIFPYRDATQSGLIPICVALNKRLIVSDAGALFEQANGVENIRIFKAGEVSSLRTQIMNTLAETASMKSLADSRLGEALTASDRSGQEFIMEVVELCRLNSI
jgi:glycosyltransferase involved in cell wall biosynthesis